MVGRYGCQNQRAELGPLESSKKPVTLTGESSFNKGPPRIFSCHRAYKEIVMKILHDLDRRLGAVEKFISVATLVIIVVATSCGVAFRYGLDSPLLWSNDLGTLGLVWLTFIGASMVFKGEGHIAIDVLLRALTGRGRLLLAGGILVCIGGALVAVFLAMLDILPIQNKTLIDALNLSRAAYGIPVLWMCVSMIIHIASRFVGGNLEGNNGL